jgi:hypothetical protein
LGRKPLDYQVYHLPFILQHKLSVFVQQQTHALNFEQWHQSPLQSLATTLSKTSLTLAKAIPSKKSIPLLQLLKSLNNKCLQCIHIHGFARRLAWSRFNDANWADTPARTLCAYCLDSSSGISASSWSLSKPLFIFLFGEATRTELMESILGAPPDKLFYQ